MASRSLGTLTLDLIAKIGGFESGMDRAARTADRKAKEITAAQRKAAKESEEAWSKVGGVIGAVFAGIASGAVFQKVIAETKQAELEQAQLAAVLTSTGNAAGYSQDRLNEMASVMQSSLGIAAGEVNQAQTVLLAFTNIVGENLPKAMQTAADHAARTGSSLKASAEIMGRALDVPSVGMASLQKQGFKFSESQIELAQELERTGRIAEAQKIVLDSLNESYGGAAAAARDTFGGALGALQNTINELLTGDSGSMKKMKQSVEDLNSVIASDNTRQAFATLVGWMADVAAAAINAGGHLINFGKFIGETFAKAVHGSADPIERLGDQIKNAEIDLANLRKEIARPRKFASGDGYASLSAMSEEAAALERQLKSYKNARADLIRTTNNAPSAPSLAGMPDMPVKKPGIVNLKDGKGGAKKAEGGKSQAEKDAEAAQKFIKHLQEQAFKIQEKTAYEKLFFDLQLKGLHLSESQMDKAIGLVTAIDMGRESELAKTAQIERQNALYEVQDALLSKQQQYALELSAYGLGAKAAAEMRERIGLLQQYQQKMDKMRQDQANAIAGANSDVDVARINTQFEERLKLTKAALDEELVMYDEFISAKKLKEGDWQAGAMAGLQTYLENSRDVYSQTQQIVDGAFGGMSKSLTDLVMTGKADFGALAQSIVADLVHMAIQAAITRALMSFIGFSEGGMVGGFASGGYTGPGGKYEVAGQVHKGEGVLSQEDIGAMGGPSAFEAFRRSLHLPGYADGGYVGVPPAVARGAAGGGRSGEKITIVNQTTGRIDNVVEQRISLTERALIIQESVKATAAQFGDPNSQTSRALSRNYATQRSR